MVKVLF
jgi:hypothetical protein